MNTLYAACLSRLGLTQPEAAALHDVALVTVKSWAQGKRAVPAGVWAELRAYEGEIVDRAEAMRDVWEETGRNADVVADPHHDPRNLMALADFTLSLDDDATIVEIARGIGRRTSQ